VPYEEIEYIQSRISELTKKRAALASDYEILKDAGVLGAVKAQENRKDATRKKIQSEVDTIGGRLDELQRLLARLQKVAEELEAEETEETPYPEEMYGIKLAPLDEQTRLMVMRGNRETIEVLGGKVSPNSSGTSTLNGPVVVVSRGGSPPSHLPAPGSPKTQGK